MIEIAIIPTFREYSGRLTAAWGQDPSKELKGKAETLIAALKSNLELCYGIMIRVNHNNEAYELVWSKMSFKRGVWTDRANLFAGFVYNALKELEKKYPKEIRVRWKPAAEREGM